MSYIGEAHALAPEPNGWILHVVVGNGSPFGTFQSARSPNRRFSHLWIAKDGHVEQYQKLDRASWAQSSGNTAWWSVETEGFEDEPLTEAQLRALAAWHVWCGAPDKIAASPSRRGIGTHKMGGIDWGGHECPGKIRAGQRRQIIDYAAAIRRGRQEDDDVQLTDRVDIKGKDKTPITAGQAIRGGYLQGLENARLIRELMAKIGELEKEVEALKK